MMNLDVSRAKWVLDRGAFYLEYEVEMDVKSALSSLKPDKVRFLTDIGLVKGLIDPKRRGICEHCLIIFSY